MTDPSKLIVLASDHNGVNLKEILGAQLRKDGFWPIDIGPFSRDHAVDYDVISRQASMMVHNKDVPRAILICGTGVGMSIVSNKVHGCRATIAHNMETAEKCREHNDTNVLCLGAWICTPESNISMAQAWLAEPFGEYRHVRRVARIDTPGSGIVFTNGCFDILHRGHIELLKWASQLGGRLVVGLNSDKSITALKGAGRPVNRFIDRKAALESIRWVDQVLPYSDETRHEMMDSIMPSILVKGGEWTADEVRQRDEIPDGIEIRVFPVVKDGEQKYSTTAVIEQVKA